MDTEHLHSSRWGDETSADPSRPSDDMAPPESGACDLETLYRAVIETSPDGFWILDRRGRILDVNEAYVRRSGYSRAELLTMRVGDLEALETLAGADARSDGIMWQGGHLFETLHRTKDGTIWQVEVNSVYWPIEGGRFFSFLRDIRQRKRAECLLRTRLRLADLAENASLEEVLRFTLDEAELYTGSRIGFFHFVEPDQEHVTLQTWSTNTLACTCQSSCAGLHYAVSDAGVWADCIRQRTPVIHNDYAALPNRKGLPAGHAPILREMILPVQRNDLIVALIGVGNKQTDYGEDDVEILRQLADLAMDIIERKRIEGEKRQIQERLEFVIEGSKLGAYNTDLKTGRAVVNDRYLQMLGYSPGETTITREKWLASIHPDDMPRVLHYAEAIDKGHSDFFEAEYRVRHASGYWIWVLDRGRGFDRDSGGRPRQAAGTRLDITERRRAEIALLASEERYRALVNLLPYGVQENTLGGRITFANPALERIHGYGPGGSVGHYIWDFLADEAECKPLADYLQMLVREQPPPTPYHTQIRQADGTVLDIRVDWAYRRDDKCRMQGFIAVITDITEQRRAETRLNDYMERLEHLSRRLLSVQEDERYALARELHDDLAQQLAAIKLNLGVLIGNPALAEQRDRITLCLDIADQIIAWTRDTARHLRPTVLDDRGLAAALHWFARWRQEGADYADCHIEVRDNLSPLPPMVETTAFRIVQEAVNNAIRHGEACHIAITADFIDHRLTLVVEDDGKGFDPTALMGDAHAGLGLISLRERAELLDGQFTLTSRPGHGTRIEVVLPVAETVP